MKRYFYELLTEDYDALEALIPDGSNKQTAINKAKAWMRENGVKFAKLSVNSLTTSNLLDVIDITIE